MGLGEEVYRTQQEGSQTRHKYLITRVETVLTKINLECKKTKTHLTIMLFLCTCKNIILFKRQYVKKKKIYGSEILNFRIQNCIN